MVLLSKRHVCMSPSGRRRRWRTMAGAAVGEAHLVMLMPMPMHHDRLRECCNPLVLSSSSTSSDSRLLPHHDYLVVPSWISAWSQAIQIREAFSRLNCPTQCLYVECSHRTWYMPFKLEMLSLVWIVLTRFSYVEWWHRTYYRFQMDWKKRAKSLPSKISR